MLKISYWIKASRPLTLIASIAPVLIVSAFCYKNFQLNSTVFVCTLIAASLIQIMTNFINDLYDYKKGSDNENRLGPTRMVQAGHLNEIEMKKGILIVLGLAIAIGVFLVYVGGLPIFMIGLSSFVLAYLYTATAFSIAYNGMGEIFVFIYFGLVASIGTAYLQTLKFSYEALIIGVVVGALNVALLVINNLRDRKEDAAANKKTLVVLFGDKFGQLELAIMLAIPFVVLFNAQILLGDNFNINCF